MVSNGRNLTHSNIGSELSIAPGEAQVLLQQATENQLLSATSGLTEGAPALIENVTALRR